MADEAKRRDLILEATTELHRARPELGQPTDRMSRCTQDQLSAVFALTWLRADPLNLKRALPVANPDDAAEADAQRRAVFALSAKGVREEEIARIAAPLCRRHRVGNWRRLPSTVLLAMTRWKQFSPRARAKPAPALPLARQATADEMIVYELRPSPRTVVGPV